MTHRSLATAKRSKQELSVKSNQVNYKNMTINKISGPLIESSNSYTKGFMATHLSCSEGHFNLCTKF